MSHHFGAEYLRGRIELAVLDGTAIAAGEAQHTALTQQLGKVVIEIACLLGILQNKKQR